MFTAWIIRLIDKRINYYYESELVKLKEEITKLEKQSFELWQMKRDACLEALNIANVIFTNIEWSNIGDFKIEKEELNVPLIRNCQNKLATTCNNSKVIEIFNSIIFVKTQISIDIIIDLRQAIRVELGLEKFEENRDHVFLFGLKNKLGK